MSTVFSTAACSVGGTSRRRRPDPKIAVLFDSEPPLTWFAVNKTVDDKPAVQFERLVGELTAFLSSAFLRVERHGPDARFQPIKTPDDMGKERPDIVAALKARGSL